MDQDDQNYNNNARSSNLGGVRSADARRQDFQSHSMGPPGAPPPHRPRGKFNSTLSTEYSDIYFFGGEGEL